MLALVVDDDSSIRQHIAMILQRNDFRTIEAADGVQALQIVQELGAGVDLILTDVQMPRSDGITFSKAVKRAYPDVPIILLSGYGNPSEKFDGFVEKPFRAMEVLESVWSVIGRKAALASE